MSSPDKPKTVEKTPFLYEWAVIVAPLLFMIPAGFHYKNNELGDAGLLFILSLLRLGNYFHAIRKFIGYFTYDLCDMLFTTLLYSNLVLCSLWYRPDLTSHIIMFLCLWQSWIMMFDISLAKSEKRIALWYPYMSVLLMANAMLRDVSHPILIADFTKGFFWGSLLQYLSNYSTYSWENTKNYIKEKTTYLFSHIQLAPYRK